MFFNIKKLPDLYLRARINNVRARGRKETPLWVLVHEFSKTKERLSDENLSFFVAKLGLEPRQTEPESVVLPLHHLAISNIRLSVNG